jgi:hypothetical protein
VSRTNPLHLVLLAVLGAAGAWFVEVALAATGNAVVVPPVTLAIALTLILLLRFRPQGLIAEQPLRRTPPGAQP